MDSSSILQSRNKIYYQLDNKHLKQAFLEMKKFTTDPVDWRFREKLEQLEIAYHYMLSYMGEGFNDPERDKLYRKLLADTYHLADMVTDQLLQHALSSQFYSKRRLYLSGADTLENTISRFKTEAEQLALSQLLDNHSEENKKKLAHIQRKIEDAAANVFFAIWTNLFPNQDEMIIIEQFLRYHDTPLIYQEMFVSALTLNVLTFYDEQKLFLLIDLIESREDNIRMRALVGLLLILQTHINRSMTTDSVANRLYPLLEDNDTIRDIRMIQLQFIRTRETERITRKLNDEILPEMMKMASPLYNKIKTDDLMKDSDEQDFNPEWEDLLSKSDIGDKLKEISELQMEGSDVLMSAFANLKSFPFFSQLQNWFIPFFSSNSAITRIFPGDQQNNQLFEFITGSRFLCNSDKYSFALSLTQMPESQRNMMADQFTAQGEELEQMNKLEESKSSLKKRETISNLYIQDLYRFFKLYPQHHEFQDPFLQDLSFFRIPVLKPIFNDSETLHILAEMFFRKEFYDDAVNVYAELTQINHTNPEFFQKLGFCYQRLGLYEKAIKAYSQAEIIHPDSSWTLRRLAQCLRNIKKPAEALVYYERFAKLNPENLSAEMNMGHCFLEMKDYENALLHYFKVDYLDPSGNKAWRPVAWCSFLTGKYDQAQRYYKKIIEDNPGYLDFINAGHAEWALGNIKSAIEFYRLGYALLIPDKEKFEKTFLQDKADLIRAGISETDFYLMLDQLLYVTEE